jgi:nitrite reductase (NADH) large subunit
VERVVERGQLRPADRDELPPSTHRRLRVVADRPDESRWVRVASVGDVPPDGGIAVRHGDEQIAVFHFAARGTWYATQNLCPHKREMVLARGILGDQAGVPKVACPLHKKTFGLEHGRCLSGDDLSIKTYPVRVEGDDVLVELPPAEERRLAGGER